jgi:hypothetical protein
MRIIAIWYLRRADGSQSTDEVGEVAPDPAR